MAGASQQDNSPITDVAGKRESQGDFSVLQMSMLKHPQVSNVNNTKKVMFKLEDTLQRSSQYSKSGTSRHKQNSASQQDYNSSRSLSPQVPNHLQNSSGIG